MSSSWGGQLEAWHGGCQSLVSLKVRVLRARSRDHRDSASSALSYRLYPRSGIYFFGLVKVQAVFLCSQAVTQSLALACKLIAAGFGKEFFPPQTPGLLDWCINNKC